MVLRMYNGEKYRLRRPEVLFKEGRRNVHQFVLVIVLLKQKRRSKYRLFKSLSNKKCVQTKTVCFLFFCFFFKQFFVRSKTKFVIFNLFLYENYVYFKKPVVVNLLRLLTHRSKQFCGLTLFREKKNFPPSVFVVACLSCWEGKGLCFWMHGVGEPD